MHHDLVLQNAIRFICYLPSLLDALNRIDGWIHAPIDLIILGKFIRGLS